MKKFFCIFFTTILLLGTISSNISSANTNEILERKNQLQYVEGQIRENERAIEQLNLQSSKLSQEIQKIDDLVMATEMEIAQIEQRIRQAEENLVTLNYEKNLLSQKLDKAKQSFNELTFDMTGGKNDYLDWVINTDSIDSLNLRLSQLNTVYSIYDDIVNKNESDRLYTQSKEGTIILEKQQLEKDREIVKKKKMFVEEQLNKKNQLLAQLQNEKEYYEHSIDELEQVSEELTSIIKKLQASGGSYRKIVRVGGKFAWPSDSSTRVTSPFGYRIHPIFKTKKLHTGLDIGAAKGTGVLAAENGVVITSGWIKGYGYTVIIDHGDGISTLYGHNSKLLVRVGEKVQRGQKIAQVGSTGYSTGPHIHFEVRINGKPTNPLPYLQ